MRYFTFVDLRLELNKSLDEDEICCMNRVLSLARKNNSNDQMFKCRFLKECRYLS